MCFVKVGDEALAGWPEKAVILEEAYLVLSFEFSRLSKACRPFTILLAG